MSSFLGVIATRSFSTSLCQRGAPMSSLVSVLRSTGARLREPGVWEAWTPHKEPIPAAHPRGESCVFAPWPRSSKALAKVPQRLCLRNLSSDFLSADVKKKGRLPPECLNLVELFDWPLYRPGWAARMTGPEKDALDAVAAAEFSTRSIAFDFGANIGLCTLALLLYSNASVVAFEPNPINLYHLTRSLQHVAEDFPDIARRVVVYPLGIGEADATRLSCMNPGNGGDSVVAESDCRAGAGATGAALDAAPQPVTVRRLDALFSPSLAERVRIVKMDVQGYECRILDSDGGGVLGSVHAIHAESEPPSLVRTGCSVSGLRTRLASDGKRWVKWIASDHFMVARRGGPLSCCS